MIEFDEVTVKAGDKRILDGVSFSLAAGEKAVITGPTGSGKSTILLTLLGAYEIARGRVFFDGRELSTETLSTVRRSIAWIGQEPILGDGTVREALLLPFQFAANRTAAPTEERLLEALASLELEESILGRRTSVISGGEKQRVAITRALLLDKRVFLADEITSALDEHSSAVVKTLFLTDGFTVLTVSHDPQWRQSFGTTISIVAGRVTGVAR